MCKPRSRREYPEGEARRSRRACTAVTSSTATRTAWRSASAASCARACARRTCIYVRGADNPIDDPVSPGERYGFVYEINYLRCIHCDLCVEACPTEAITETKLFEFSFTNRADAIYTKDELLVGDDGRAKRMPWELWIGGEDDDTSAWMRATSSGGDADVRGPRRAGRASSASACARPSGRRRGEAAADGSGASSSSCAAAALVGALGVVLARNPVHSALFLLLTLVHDGRVLPACRTPTSSRSSRSSCTRARSSCCSCSSSRCSASTSTRRSTSRAGSSARSRSRSARSCSRSGRRASPADRLGHRRRRRRVGPLEGARERQRAQTSRQALFTDYIWAFEITAVLLVIAVVGGVVLARRSGHRPLPIAGTNNDRADAVQPREPWHSRSDRA